MIRTRSTAALLALLLPLAAATGCASDDGEPDGVFDDTSVSVDSPAERAPSRSRDDPRDPRSPNYQGPRTQTPGGDEPVDEGPVPPL